MDGGTARVSKDAAAGTDRGDSTSRAEGPRNDCEGGTSPFRDRAAFDGRAEIASSGRARRTEAHGAA
jgi:hypothetical protein